MNRQCRHFHGYFLILLLPVSLVSCSTAQSQASKDIDPVPIDPVPGAEQTPAFYRHTETFPSQKSIQHAQSADRCPGETATIRVQTGRYSILLAAPTEAQRNPLQVVIEVRIPDELVSIEQSLHYVLKRSGYRLADDLPAEAMTLLVKPLPAVHRRLGPMTLEQALTVLIGPTMALVVDDQRRLIRYRAADQQSELTL